MLTIPVCVKTTPDGQPLSREDWLYPRDLAYEATARQALPPGWELYSVIDADKSQPAKDFGATRTDGRGHVFGVRTSNGVPWLFRASVPARSTGHDPKSLDFMPTIADLAAACRWVDEQLARHP